jgi:hypothetical protein
MFLLKKIGFIVVLILAATPSLNATIRKVLFIGNSYTYTNNMPLMLQALTAAMGDTLIYDESDPGGYTFEQHSSYAPTLAKIFSQHWDIVVLQEQSQRPAFPPSQVEVEVYPYAHALDSIIHQNNTCTQTLFMMTWGHANGDPANCMVVPDICTFDGMQQRLRESYMEMTMDNNAIVAPVGAAFKVAHDDPTAPWLFQADSSHPVVPGSYLETCVLYSSIFHKRTSGCSYLASLNASDAQKLQQIADQVAMDSLAQWQLHGHYPSAAFNYTQAGNTVQFTSNSGVPANYEWSFGDGGNDNTISPSHTYASGGVYPVTHTASSGCFSETITANIQVGPAGIAPLSEALYPITIGQQGNGGVLFNFPDARVYDRLDIYNASGQCLRSYAIDRLTIRDHLVPGYYIYHSFSNDRKVSFYNKLVIY